MFQCGRNLYRYGDWSALTWRWGDVEGQAKPIDVEGIPVGEAVRLTLVRAEERETAWSV